MLTIIQQIVSGKPFEFYSPYTLEEIHDHLYKASERDKAEPSAWNPKKNLLMITQDAIDDQSFRFYADKDLGRNLLLFANGRVEQESDGVRVTGAVTIGSFTLGFMGIWIIPWLLVGIIFLLNPRPEMGVGNFIPLFGIFIAGSLLYTCKQGQDKLYSQLHEILGKSKKKNM